MDFINEEGAIYIPNDILVSGGNDPMKSIIELTYPNLMNIFGDPFYHEEKVIVTPKNEIVHEINNFMMDGLPRLEV